MHDYSNVIRCILNQWRDQRRPISGVFVKGSVAQLGYVAPGSDIDVCIITPFTPDPTWFEEKSIGSQIVEIYPLSKTDLFDIDVILSSPDLPFSFSEGIIIEDPEGIIKITKEKITPFLCHPRYRRERAATCYNSAVTAFKAASQQTDLEKIRFEVTVGWWHTIALASAIAVDVLQIAVALCIY
jgi:hypothetical protein